MIEAFVRDGLPRKHRRYGLLAGMVVGLVLLLVPSIVAVAPSPPAPPLTPQRLALLTHMLDTGLWLFTSIVLGYTASRVLERSSTSHPPTSTSI